MRGSGEIRKLTSIVAIDLRGAIGCDNTLPWRLRTDMSFFRTQTTGNTVVMGRKTYQSLGEKPLPRRNNIVLSHNGVLFDATPNCQLALSVDEALFRANVLNDDEVFIIGGAQTYGQFDEYVDRYLITIVDHEVPNADAFLTDNVLQSIYEWDRTNLGDHPAVPDQDEFAFSIYEVAAPDPEARYERRQQLVSDYNSKIAPKKSAARSARPALRTDQDAFAF